MPNLPGFWPVGGMTERCSSREGAEAGEFRALTMFFLFILPRTQILRRLGGSCEGLGGSLRGPIRIF